MQGSQPGGFLSVTERADAGGRRRGGEIGDSISGYFVAPRVAACLHRVQARNGNKDILDSVVVTGYQS